MPHVDSFQSCELIRFPGCYPHQALRFSSMLSRIKGIDEEKVSEDARVAAGCGDHKANGNSTRVNGLMIRKISRREDFFRRQEQQGDLAQEAKRTRLYA